MDGIGWLVSWFVCWLTGGCVVFPRLPVNASRMCLFERSCLLREILCVLKTLLSSYDFIFTASAIVVVVVAIVVVLRNQKQD